MTTMTAQPPLPLTPAGSVPVGLAAGLCEGAEGGVVFCHGQASFTWEAGDEAGRRFAAVQLVRIKAAKAYEVAAAFGVSAVTLWRWQQAWAGGGVLGLVPGRSGPRGPTKLTAELTEQVRGLDAAGQSQAAIARATGVSTFTVRTALGRAPVGGDESSGADAVRDRLAGTPDPDTDTDTDTTADTDTDTDVTDTDEIVTDTAATAADEAGTVEAGTVEAGTVEAGTVEAGTGGAGSGELVVLADPVARGGERAAARAGLLEEAPVRFTPGARLPLVGLLLVLPGLEATGLLAAAEGVYGRLRDGFYGLRVTLLMLVFLALLREPRAEGATRIRPADLGRLLGLDRAPEVKTLRRKLAQLAEGDRGSELITELARRHVTARPDAVGFLHVDGHVRVYSGTRKLPKTHITRMRIAAPATCETWVADAEGDPVFVVTADASASTASELVGLLPRLRELVADRRVTVVFDRGGYSPACFAAVLAAGFDLLTYRKGPVEPEPVDAFAPHQHTSDDGAVHTYSLTEATVSLPLPPRDPHGSEVTLRQVTRRSAGGHQTPILTSRDDLPAGAVAYRMSNRWRQENYFKYARAHFALDALDGYAATGDDPTRQVPNPAKKTAQRATAAARAELARAQSAYTDAVALAGTEAGRNGRGRAEVAPTAAGALATARASLAAARAHAATIPARVPLSQARPGAQLLDPARKQATHAVRMAAYNAESALARALAPHYPRAHDEARALLREAFTASGDIHISGQTLHIQLDPLTAPRRTRALAALADDLTATATVYPGTDLTIEYSVKPHPSPT